MSVLFIDVSAAEFLSEAIFTPIFWVRDFLRYKYRCQTLQEMRLRRLRGMCPDLMDLRQWGADRLSITELVVW